MPNAHSFIKLPQKCACHYSYFHICFKWPAYPEVRSQGRICGNCCSRFLKSQISYVAKPSASKHHELWCPINEPLTNHSPQDKKALLSATRRPQDSEILQMLWCQTLKDTHVLKQCVMVVQGHPRSLICYHLKNRCSFRLVVNSIRPINLGPTVPHACTTQYLKTTDRLRQMDRQHWCSNTMLWTPCCGLSASQGKI